MAFAVIRARSRVGWSRLYKRRAGPPRGRRRQRRRRAPRSSAPPTPPSSGAPRPPTGPPPPRSRFGSPARRAPGCCLPGGPGAAAAPGEPRRPAGRPRRRRPRHGGRQARRADGHLLQLPGGDAALRVPGRRVPAAHAARQAVQGQGPAAAAPPVPFQDAAGDLRRDPGGGGGGGVPDGGGEGQEVVPAKPGVPAPQHAEPVAAEGAAQRLQTEEQPGLQRLRLGPVTCAARSRDSRAQAARRDGPACEPRGGPRAPHLGVPHPPSTPVGGPPGPSPDCELVRAPGAELAPAGSARRGAGAPGKGGPPFFALSHSTLLSDGLKLRFLHTAPPCPPPPPARTPVHTHADPLSLNTFIIVRRGRWDLGRSAAGAVAGGLIFIFALRWLTAFI
ncbi:hypothetical protein FD754_016771 [Muntiacus muntjak]|uniref:Uncharacterized protein n=1 Tax=Muntiacus muntjak TaxID=9888 RepID=A0A5N3VRY8_MUNMU|nr:hypothetical protein FD754_016771 [Muntiacus muntjak]